MAGINRPSIIAVPRKAQLTRTTPKLTHKPSVSTRHRESSPGFRRLKKAQHHSRVNHEGQAARIPRDPPDSPKQIVFDIQTALLLPQQSRRPNRFIPSAKLIVNSRWTCVTPLDSSLCARQQADSPIGSSHQHHTIVQTRPPAQHHRIAQCLRTNRL